MNHGAIDPLLIAHFFTFFSLGVFWKNQYLGALFFGILWEIVEYIMANNDFTRKILLNYWIIPEQYWNETIDNQLMDLFVNMIGYHIGNIILFKIKLSQ